MKHSMIISGVLFAAITSGLAFAESKASNHWLLDVDNDEERFQRIERMFAGFSGAMAEVGNRYQHAYDAVQDGNYELASYHWDKLRSAIELGYLRRPGRAANSKGLFLETAWPELQQQLSSKDSQAIRQSFQQARHACMACHVAEEVAFMNDQPLFRNTAEFK
ncbi:MAG: hypothetical protein LAT66_07980 [Alkalimonas sp.]|nr:hypothetical protein [Alkalimonas sp.]